MHSCTYIMGCQCGPHMPVGGMASAAPLQHGQGWLLQQCACCPPACLPWCCRLSGLLPACLPQVMKEMVQELWVSYKAGQNFEGDMLKLTNYAAALATLLETVRHAADGRCADTSWCSCAAGSCRGCAAVGACRVAQHVQLRCCPAGGCLVCTPCCIITPVQRAEAQPRC